jgi:hypothetical protein
MTAPAPAPGSLATDHPAPTPPAALRFTWRSPRLWAVVAMILVIGTVVQRIGSATIPLGSLASITILPMVWGLLVGGVISGQPWRRLPLDLQSAAGTIMGLAVLLLVARLAFTMGPNLQLLVEAGPALLLQEVGHLFGTIVLALPLAVLLRMGPATVGATFSIDREGSFAMVSERYGADSPQYRGVLAMYAFGSLFGAVAITLIASVATSLGLFDPLALAMGAGVGSGSMMAAAASTVAAAHPELSDQVLAVAATSNVITGLLGVYVGMYVALPLADRFYRLLTRRQEARVLSGGTEPAAPTTPRTGVAALVAAPTVSIPTLTTLLVLVGLGTAVSSVAAGSFGWSLVAGYALLCALVGVGVLVARLTRGTVGAMVVVITLGVLLSAPFSPVADSLLTVVSSIDFLSVCTLVLTIAGLSIGKDLPALRAIGWKIVPVGLVAIAASYLVSVVVAELALGLWG